MKLESIQKVGDPMTRFDHILFATDFSPASTAALPYAVSIARHFGSKLYLTHVIPRDAFDLIPMNERDSAIENIRTHAKDHMSGLRAAALLKGIPHEVFIDHGDVWPVLAAMVGEYQIDLIVIGSHGRRGVEKLLIGSVAEEILRRALIPVLIVGPESPEGPKSEAPLRRILYATDFSPESEPAMHYACRLSKEYNAALSFLHVTEDAYQEPLSTRLNASSFIAMRLAEKHWEIEEGIAPEFHVDFGPRAGCILDLAEKLNVEMIVLGVRGTSYPRLAAHLPGPTAYDVVSQAHCPVLVIRGQPHPGT